MQIEQRYQKVEEKGKELTSLIFLAPTQDEFKQYSLSDAEHVLGITVGDDDDVFGICNTEQHY